MANNQQVENISIQDRGPQNTAADWVRQLRFSSDVNKSTLGVDTDRVTPQLLVAASKKLLGISRGTQKGDAKDSMRYQKVFGPVQYFAQHIQRDGGSVARQMLWKATNKGNLDFISTNSLQPHVNSVFNQSNLTRFIDNSTPLDGIDNSMLLTRLGQGGISSEDSAPIQMRLVQPSYYGYVGPARSQEKSPGITAYMTKNVVRGTDGKLYQKMLNARTGKQQLVDSQKAAASIVTTNQILDTKDKYVYAMGGDSGVQIVPRDKVDYILPRADDAYSMAANAVPMLSGVKSMRLLMGCLHPETPVPFVDQNGFTDIVPAKRLGNYGAAYLSSCDKDGKQTLVKLSKVVSRFSDFTRPFKRIVTSSGRVLITSPDHKWYIKQGQKFIKVTADKLETGMLVPRSLFTKLPYKLTTILGVNITRQICVLVGRLLKSFQQTSKIYRFSYIKNQMFDQQQDINKAFQQLNVIGCNHYVRDNIYYVSISDQRLLDWIQTQIHLQLSQRKVPKSILSLPVGFTSQVIDSYCKQGDNVGQDMYGDAWLLDIPSVQMRDGLALMLGKLYADTLYRDSYSNGRPQRALKAVPVKPTQNIVLQTIVKITDQPAPAFMVDIDCDDNVYAVGNGIITHNSKYALQAVPLQQPQAPLVRSLDQATGKDMDTLMGKLVGTQWAPKPGVVKAVRKDRIDMLYDDGTTGSVDLYQNFPANAKGWISNYPVVKAGDRVAKDQLLAKSNYSDDKGVCAMGRNLRVGYLSYHGGTYEDACVISQTAAKKMGYTTMYKTGMDIDKTIRNSKSLYNTWKPGEYSKQQMQQLDQHGIVKVGAKLNKGDPMILGIRSIEPSPGTMGKRLLTDVTETWDHQHQGVVTDVVRTRNGIKVYAKVSAPLQVGDKISQRYGGKATIAQILPDQQMPKDAKQRPLQLLFDPLGIVSRCYDKQTKFLTKHGWKGGDQVQYDQQLYIYDPQTDTCRWGKQLQPMHKSFYRGVMYGAKNKQVDFLVTPNHTMWTDKQSTAIQLYGQTCSLPTPQQRVQVTADDWFTAPYHDYVYCPTVQTGYVVTSRNSKVLCAGNTNPSQMIQVALGKIAQKTGKPVIVPQFMPPGQSRLKWAKQQLKKYNIPWKQKVFDPETGRTIDNVFTGKMYFLPLKHIADTKMSARGTDQYTAQGIPGGKGETGSKRIGGLQVAGLVGHDAFNFLQDAKVIRGQANSQFWRSLRTGQIPVMPGEPLVHKKFFAHLQGAGMRIRKTTKGVSIMALTNQDVNQLAGSRQLKSKDTYQQKTFREIDGGLFGKDIFGTDGDRWGYIQLDEPLPNPVMQQPLAKLLRISDKQFQSIIAGQQEVNGMKNASDMKAALQKIDLKAQKHKALAQLKQASPSKRDAALKRYVAIAQMQQNGANPADYMLDRIPVLPPNFRPISTQGGLTMVADSNYLYAQLLDARDDAREAKALPQQYQNQARANIYRKWKQLTGLYDPQSKKLRAKDVKGLLRWALGKTPKFSAVQRKVIGSTVDTVGRGVVVPDSHLKLNQIGLPQSIAWNVYAPFITRGLVMSGYSPVDAMKLVKTRNQAAKQLLVKQMAQRPVVMNRAPSLHKLSLMGFWPQLTTGYAIKVPPSIVTPFNMDFDGDTVNIHVPVSKASIKDVVEKMMPQRNLISARKGQILYPPEKAFTQGIYVATRMGEPKAGGIQTFNTVQEAKQAYKKGLIDIDTPIDIKEKK